MKRTLLGSGLIAIVVMISATIGVANECFYCPVGVYHYNPELADNGYTLVGGNLLDMEGNILHSLPVTGGETTLQDDGTIMMLNVQRGETCEILQYDWDGNLIWSFGIPPELIDDYHFHHDYERIWNQDLQEYTVLIVNMHPVDAVEVEEAGADQDTLDNARGFSADSIIEVRMIPQDPEDPLANIIWEWRFFDHIVQYHDSAGVDANGRSTFGDINNPEDDFARLDINADGYGDGNGSFGIGPDWNHVNGISYNAERDEIVMSARGQDEIFVIDHSLSTEEAAGSAGDFVYRWGNPYNWTKDEDHKRSELSNGRQQLFGQHHTKWVTPSNETPEGESEQLNIMLFDNSAHRPGTARGSAVFEIDPFDADGNYVRETAVGYQPPVVGELYGWLSEQVVWKFSASEFGRYHPGLFSAHGSQPQRTPGGNVLISATESAHLVEVTPDGQIAWEYLSGFPREDGGDLVNRREPGQRLEATGYRLAFDFPGLVGKTFVAPNVESPGVWDSENNLPGFMTGSGSEPEAPPAPTGWGTSGLAPSAGGGGGGVAGGGGVDNVGGGY